MEYDFYNITDWALEQFRANNTREELSMSKEDIFYYVYAVRHDPTYRERHARNLRREFPRVPPYPEFRRWADWGRRLMALHLNYETVAPWPLHRLDVKDKKAASAGVSPRGKIECR